MDDQPIWLTHPQGPHPRPCPIRSRSTTRAASSGTTTRSDEFADLIVDQFDEMLAQSARQPLVCPISLHPFVIGRPYRIRRLRRALAAHPRAPRPRLAHAPPRHLRPHRIAARRHRAGQPLRRAPMKIGVVFPQTEIGNDPAAIRDYAAGRRGAWATRTCWSSTTCSAPTPSGPGGWKRPVHLPPRRSTSRSCCSASSPRVTRRLELVTGILILPQRQTALVAKQAAEVDVLSGGRLRLGVGVGWNPVEFEALGEDFTNRGRRIEEQVEVLRALWTERAGDVQGPRAHDPRRRHQPAARPAADPDLDRRRERGRSLRRAARLADGWMPHFRPGAAGAGRRRSPPRPRPRGRARPAGVRDRGAHGARADPRGEWGKELEAWQAMRGISTCASHTAGMGLATPGDHVEMLRRFRQAVGLK